MSEELYRALLDFVRFAETNGWSNTTTGRQILLKEGRKALEWWNTRPDSKPYKCDTWKEWWGSLPFDGRKAYTAADGFNAARELKDD